MKTANAIELKDEERTRCEVWTRVMGYHRPVSAFNPGKKSEHAERVCFEEGRVRRQKTKDRGQLAGAVEISPWV